MRRFLLAALLAAALCAQPLPQRLQALVDASPVAQRGLVGVGVFDPAANETLYQLNQQRFFVPASNTKLFTTALALMRLGPDYRFQTAVRAAALPDERGRLAGDLRLVGGGDPMLSARAVPYQRGPITGNPLQAIEALADEVAARGVKRIAGDVIGDDTAYVWAPYPDGWAEGDTVWDYGAPVSALTLNDNVFTLTLRALGSGAPPALFLSPPLEFYSIDNRVRTAPGLETRVEVERLAGSRQMRLWGTMSSDPVTETRLLLAIPDPALYAASALADALARRGIAIGGRPVARHRFANEVPDLRTFAGPPPAEAGVELARRASPPLIELIRVIDKVSQNLHAELMLREVGRVRRGIGSREAGLEEERAFLAELGIPESEYHFADGSGLSRMNLVTPDAVVRLLTYMYRSPHRDAWMALLPLGGQDGTLSTRFAGEAAARRIHAKTGSLSHVAALSGYAESAGRGVLVFSVFANNYNGRSGEVRALIDRLALAVVE